jgi:hypothetical protein
MSNLWNRLTGGSEGNEAANVPATHPEQHEEPAPTDSPVTATVARTKPAYGIDQANDLMAAIPIDDKAEVVVVDVIRKTLESVGVQVGAIIDEARLREVDLRTRIEDRRAAIAELERQISSEQRLIDTMEHELALTGRTRERLELSEKSAPKPVVPPPLLPTDHDRPTVVAMPVSERESVIGDADVESVHPRPPSVPKKP